MLPANASGGFLTLGQTAINWSNEWAYVFCLSQNTPNIDSKCIRHLFGVCSANAVTIKVFFLIRRQTGTRVTHEILCNYTAIQNV